MDVNPSSSSHVTLLQMVSRCLSGQWLINPQWLLENADLMIRAESSADEKRRGPEMKASLMLSQDGAFAAANSADTIGKGQAVGVIEMIGPVYKYPSYYLPTASKSLVSILNALAADDRVGGVKLKIDSPGGMVSGTREVYQTILNYPKQVLVEVDGYCASAAYYMAAPANRIVATQPNDLIGSIGTYLTMADWLAYYKTLGLDLYEIYAEASSEKNEGSRQLFASKGEKTELIQQQLTAYNDLFIADVKAGRGDKLTGKGQDPMKGRVFFPTEAKENGLIDDQVSPGETLLLLSDMIATNQKSSIQMNLSELLAGLKSAIKAAEKGDDAGEQQSGATQPTVADLQAQLAKANGQLEAITKERDTAKSTVETLTGEKATLEEKVSKLGEQPGAMGTQSQKREGDDLEDKNKDSWQAKVAALEHNQIADQMFL